MEMEEFLYLVQEKNRDANLHNSLVHKHAESISISDKMLV